RPPHRRRAARRGPLAVAVTVGFTDSNSAVPGARSAELSTDRNPPRSGGSSGRRGRGWTVIDAPDRRNFVRSVPKAEIHLHLEGSVRLETLLGIARARGDSTDGEAQSQFAALYVHRDFPDFLQNFRRLCAGIRRPEDFARIATDLSRGLQEDR